MRSPNIQRRFLRRVLFIAVVWIGFVTSATAQDSTTTSATPVNTYRGGYYAWIKDSGTNWSDNYEDTVSALKANHYNFYGYNAMDRLYVDPASPYGDGTYSRFEQLLRAADGEGIFIFGGLGETHFFENNYCNAYWLTKYHDKMGTTCNHADYDDGDAATTADAEKLRADWLESLKLGAQWMSQLSKTYPHLVGFNVDDFFHVQSATTNALGTSSKNYSSAQVAELTAAAKSCPDPTTKADSCNSNFKFWPTIYYGSGMPTWVSPGYIVGQDYESYSQAGDYLAVNFTFTIRSKPSSFGAKFFMSDQYDDYENNPDAAALRQYKGKIYKVARLNDEEIMRKDVWGAVPKVEGQNLNLDVSKLKICSSASSCPTNTLSIGLYVQDVTTTNALKFMISRYLNVWGVEFKRNGMPFSAYTVSYTLPTARDGDADGITDFFADATGPYSLVPSVDGVFAVLPGDSVDYDPLVFNAMLAETKKALGDKDLIVVPYGNLPPNNIAPGVLKNQIAAIGKIAQGVAVWNPPLEITGLMEGKGVFAQRAATSPYDGYAYWSGYNNPLTAWFDSWTLKDATGTVSLKIKDSSSGTTDGIDEIYMVKRIFDSNRNEFYRDGTRGTECDSTATSSTSKECPGYDATVGTCQVVCTPGSANEEITIDLGSETTDVTLMYELTGEFGPLSFNMSADLLTSTASWVFDTGTLNKCHLATYYAMQQAYAALAGKTVTSTTGDVTDIMNDSLFGLPTLVSSTFLDVDSDGDGISDCADPRVDTPDNFWFINVDDASAACLTKSSTSQYAFLEGRPKTKIKSTDPGVLVPGVYDPAKAQTQILGGACDQFFPDYGVYIESPD